ncbi:hypothetical protein VB711_06670 [Cronbergia sp. UHCC 0137]|nr:hypothetical protein [Cronbergia sp. UHCC 0137]MEA5617521.1 hypothetical protein [Cronbergia sp. UHCC 0137]
MNLPNALGTLREREAAQGAVVRSRYPQKNRDRNYTCQAVMLP